MKYRIRLDLAFNEIDPADDILDKARDQLDKAVVLNPSTPFEERGYITLEECYHDQNPHMPCVLLENDLVPYPE